MYACMYMLVYLWAQNPQLIIPREEFLAQKTSLPPAEANCCAGPGPTCLPHKEALSGAEADPRTSPGACQLLQKE